ncbi:lysophospholipid acyltransferase family protein [Primorskyibacter sp. 2E107]|uniref:lysophospholipid acyltransferase family protein n=1 Tax=Primorskyibacter sp. 2E107 TaxID=3403458 RepID=UPI003AF81A12
MDWLRTGAARLTGTAIAFFAHLVTAARAIWMGIEPVPSQRVYFANHTSNGDFVLLWASLPPALRARTRPVAAADYWLTSPMRRFIGRDVFRAVLIERDAARRSTDPVSQMAQAIETGASLILFPEGTRNMGRERLLPFKSGLFHLASQCPEVDLVPVWIDNLNNVMPKGEIIPIPLLCTVTFGAPMHVAPGEDKATFLKRAETALLALAPEGQDT